MAASNKTKADRRTSAGTRPPDRQREHQAGRTAEQQGRTGRSRATATSPTREHEQESDERRRREERILAAAAALLVRWGYRKTTIDDVAREAGVGKGTIYLHWKDKNSLFRAAIMRANQQVGDDVMRRMTADPEGGLLHRLWVHGMMAALSNPLMAAIMKGQPDIFQGLMDSFDRETRAQLMGNAKEYVGQLQRAGLVRADLPVSVITLLMSALKLGIVEAAELVGQDHMPSMEQVAEAVSDLMRRWLEPEQPPSNSDEGKQILAEWQERVQGIAELRE
jgi:AcrR family transcriptional regulator